MPFDFKLPDLGEGIAEVEVRQWLVAEGDQVAEHQPVLEVETDKAVVQVPAPRSGVVARIHRRPGEVVKVGETLVTIAESGADAAPRPRSVGIVGELPDADDLAPPASPQEFAGLATPMVRKLARERGIDLRFVTGNGPRGCITPEDLDRFEAVREGREAAPQPITASSPQELERRSGDWESFGPVERVELRGLRRAIARNVLAAQCRSAFVTSMEEVDITEIWELRAREQGEVEARGSHLTFLPFFIKAAQHALREHPMLNASIDDATQTIIVKKHYHFGIAVATPEGLMVPVIRDVEKKSIIELAQAIQELGRKAQERTISREDLRGSSFTITNYGHFGGTFATPIINWPDVAILGFGRIVERPWVHRGQIAIRRIVPVSLTFDHRVTDGAEAAQFLGKVLRSLEDPGLLFIEGS
ncbi:dihydrolipoamide acetyltransferase component of pyruvate dehydrogenase complex [Geomonas silvestris]|uniref:Dihydrolipoamide acetyltransferase component of pyruvate dehydrogenase complex n=1 Tax=Geomonas silvestris TaxID=2740184 RepID=A0A6V8MIF1_9BACT|nr:dihydrolipoamide acetyltransferase family protein [Geomonas silvestris]GFO59714.1 dihydrolipoamide acetyltransferase component of pyruvate dehydrogenase complex [Geomonas silvestris]